MHDPPPVLPRKRKNPLTMLVCSLLIVHCAGADIFLSAPHTAQAQLPAGIEPLIRSYPQPTEKSLLALKRGVEHFENERYGAALEPLAEAAEANTTQIADYAILYRASANLALGRAEEALALFRLLQTRYPGSSQLQEAILGECRALLQMRQPAAVLSALQNPKLEDSAESIYCRALALENSGKPQEAISLYLRIIAKYANSKTVTAAELQLAKLSPGYSSRQSNLKTLLERVENLLRSGRNRDARALIQKLKAVQAPDAASAALRSVLSAQAEYNLGRASLALPMLKNIPESLPLLHAQALYLTAACYRKLERESSLLETRDAALRIHPKSPFTERVLYSVAVYYEFGGHAEQALEAYAAIADRFPKGEYTERAVMRSALFAYSLKRYEDALRGFRACLLSYPGSGTPAYLYWMGRSCQRLGDRAGAGELLKWSRALAGNSYYGGRALEASEALKPTGSVPPHPASLVDFAEIRSALEAQGTADVGIVPPSAAVKPIIERVHQLASADLPGLAMGELRWAIRQYPQDRALKYLMSRIYEMKNDYVGVISTLRRTFPDYDFRARNLIPQEVWDLLFPVRHQETVALNAARYNLDPYLILALIRQESAFTVDAQSKASARGLMQVLPATGRKLAREAGVSRYTVQKLFQPDINISLGTRHLAALLQHFNGKVEMALAAYNAGSDRVDRWMSQFGPSDMAEFVELIPISETRNYVKHVLTNAAFYRLLAAS